jgi:hypothetical protein
VTKEFASKSELDRAIDRIVEMMEELMTKSGLSQGDFLLACKIALRRFLAEKEDQ